MSKEFNPPISYFKFPSGKDEYGIEFNINTHGYRTAEFDTVDHSQKKFVTFGDSVTWGTAMWQQDLWPELLKEKINIPQMFNLAQRGCSSDFMVRIMPECLEYFKPDYVFVLWSAPSRFENNKDGVFYEVLASNSGSDWETLVKERGLDWPEENYKNTVEKARRMYKELNIPLIELTQKDLIPVMDHADKWPRAVNGQHPGKVWHIAAADIFADKFKNL